MGTITPLPTKAAVETPSSNAIDLIVFSPHPDDESLGCAGVIQQALEAGKRLKVVVFTNGDDYPAAAQELFGKTVEELTAKDYLDMARQRQQESLKALTTLGLKPEDLIMLGYPDAGLDKVYEATGQTPFTRQFTQKNQTYGMEIKDYHSQKHGSPASYLRQAALDDVKDLIQTFNPQQIYVTNEQDTHPDHKAAFWFVRDAIKELDYQGELYTYVIHGGPEHIWPYPRGITPTSPFESTQGYGRTFPQGVS